MSASAPASSVEATAINPRRYHETVADALNPIANRDPVCLYLETTNRCNLLCTTGSAAAPGP